MDKSSYSKVLIVDGIDYSGKDTVIDIVKKEAERLKLNYIVLGFPGYTSFGAVARKEIKADAVTEQVKLYMLLAEFVHFKNELDNGVYDAYDLVICNRYILSTIHQISKYPEYIHIVNDFITRNEINKFTMMAIKCSKHVMLQRANLRDERDPGDEKAIREYELTNIFDYADKLGLASNTAFIVNDRELYHLEEDVLTALKHYSLIFRSNDNG